jgi:hypothetical protein
MTIVAWRSTLGADSGADWAPRPARRQRSQQRPWASADYASFAVRSSLELTMP